MGYDWKDDLTYDFDVTDVIQETDKAVYVTIEGDNYWIPLSQCILNMKDDTIEISEWIANEKGLI